MTYYDWKRIIAMNEGASEWAEEFKQRQQIDKGKGIAARMKREGR